MHEEHTHEHTHADGTTHTHEHIHDHGHTHDHDHSHGEGTTHTHTYADGTSHTHTHETGHTHSNPEEIKALLAYMVHHNEHHADELAELADALPEEARKKLMRAIGTFEAANVELQGVLNSLE